MTVDETITAAGAELPILCNPFHILGISTRDNRQRIVEAAEETSLNVDADVCSKARGDLTNPRNRLAVELGWLPGISPRKAQRLLDILADDAVGVFTMEGLPTLAHTNLMASAVLALDPALPEHEWVNCIAVLAEAIDAISPETVLADVNEDRTVAGFAEVKSVETIEEGLAERRREYRENLRKALDTLPARKLAQVVTEVADQETGGGTGYPTALIDDMIDAYAVGVHGFLSKEAENIELLIERTRQAAPSGSAAMEPFLERLERVVHNWYAIAKPIQLVASTKGTAHDLSRDVAGSVRSLGIYLYNEHIMLDASQRIVRLLQEVFGSLPELAERVDDDARMLDALARRKANEERVKPVHDLCTAALEAIDGDPLAGEVQGHKVLDTGKELIRKLAQEGLDRTSITELEDILAIAAFRCAISFGNGSDRWAKPIALLEEARALAHDTDVLERIDRNLATARENHRVFGNLEPISSGPTLHTINGVGFTIYGKSGFDPRSQTYMTTYYFVLLAIPIFPICRYRVRTASGGGYRFFGKAPLTNFDRLHLAASVLGILLLFFFSI